MSKFGIHLALWTRDWSDDILPFARKAAAIGFDGVEISLLGDVARAPVDIGKAIAEMGLARTTTTGLARDTDIASADPLIRRRGVETLQAAIKTTHALGARQLSGVVYGAWGMNDGPNKQARVERAIAGLQTVAGLCEDLDVTLGVEPVNRFETDIVNTADEALAMSRAIGSPKVGILLDTFHMNIEESDPVAAIETCGRELVNFHLVDNDRGVPGGGTIDFDRQAGALRRIGYHGWITAEMFIQSGRAVSSDLSIWRPIEPDPDLAAARALAFMKKVFA